MATAETARIVTGDLVSLKRDVQQLKADLAAIARDVKSIGSATGHATAARAEEMGQRAWKKASDAEAELVQELSAHPLSGILAGFGVGFVIGKLMDSRR